MLCFHWLSSFFSSCSKITFHIKVLMELKNLNIEVIYSNKQSNPSPVFPLFFRLGNFAFLTLQQKSKWTGIHPCRVTQAACVSPAGVWKRIWAIVPQLQDGASGCREEGGSWGISPPPQGCTEGSAALQGLHPDRPLPSTPKPSRLGAWLHFHYVFMMPSALSRNHGSCLALLKYPGKWSNNQIASLTKWQTLE